MNLGLRMKLAACAAVLAVPFVGAFAPAKLQAAPASYAFVAASHRSPQPLFLSHILAITDVLNQCGPGTQDPHGGFIHCPLLAPLETSPSNLNLY